MSEQIPLEQQQQHPENISEPADVLLSQVGTNDESIHLGNNETKHLDDEVARLKAVLNSENPHAPQTDEEKRDIDSRSVYIGNVDYATTPAELQQHFASAGVVQRVTILMNKFTGQPKGFAYLEFADIDGVNKAVATLDGSSFRDRELKVSAKRTNIPGISTTNRGGPQRGRGGRGRGGRGGRGGRAGFRGGFRGGARFTPY